MPSNRLAVFFLIITSGLGGLCCAQGDQPGKDNPQLAAAPNVDQLQMELAAHEARIKELETRLAQLTAAGNQPGSAPPTGMNAEPAPAASPERVAAEPQEQPAEHEHTMRLPGGDPELKIRGFADLNLGLGTDANPLIFPLVPAGSAIHNTFELGEFDLFLSSKLSPRISFLSEVVLGSDFTNTWGLDIERLQVTYKVNPYFVISGGRYHTSIGYYNTAYHHGTWFQTATGRPFMYFFEDSGGILPVHSVGVTATGLTPGTGSLELHWIAEVGIGRSSDPNAQPVQNFLSDKNHKDFNLAAYIKPHWLSGLQVGGSFYHDVMVPAGIPHVNQNIGSAYAVFFNSSWEFLNEAVLISNRLDGASVRTNTPLMYSQIARKFGKYRPYFRYQYVNGAANDPVNVFTGRYEGPSEGVRMDYTDYVALKVQYNRLYQRNLPAANGVDMQVAYAF
jgi:hypothetical protein